MIRIIKNKATLSAVASLGAWALGCSGVPSSADSVGRVDQPIVNGSNSDSSQDFVVLLVGLIGGDGGVSEFQCSGTLIASNLVLTARHCVSHTTDGSFGCADDGTLLPGSAGGTSGQDYDSGDVLVFVGPTRPKFETGVLPAARVTKIFHDGSNDLCGHDFALALLDRKIPNALTAPIRLDGPPMKGEKFTAIGWGMTTSGSPQTRQQRSGIDILRVGPSPAPNDQSDGPIPPSEFEVGESICAGDSGGPAISDATGAIIGTVSAGGNGRDGSRNDPAGGCEGQETFNLYTQVSPFKDLVAQAFAEAKSTPWLEGEPKPVESGVTMGEGGCSIAGQVSNPLGMFLFAMCLAWIVRRRPAGARIENNNQSL